MVLKHILEGARRFKPVRTPDPNAATPTRGWRWPDWSRLPRKPKYLIAIRPRRQSQA